MKIKNTLRTLAVTVGCVGMILGVVGCGPKGVSDQALATDIQAKLYADANARTANVKVAVANGAVTLTGDAPTPDVALQVVNIANGTSGIKSVDNQIKVLPAAASSSTEMPPPVAPASAKPDTHSNLAQSTPPVAVPPAAVPPPSVPVVTSAQPPMTRRPELPPAPPRPVTVTVPVGTDIGVTTIDSISSKTNTSGQTFRGTLSSPVVIAGKTVLPSGSGATILLSNSKGAGRIKGSSELEVRLIKIEHAGQTYDVDTSVHNEIGKGRGKQTAVRSGIGAAAGAVIGAIAGGGKGAAIGSLAGGGAGAGFQLATHGQQVTIPSESRLTFSLQSPIVVTLRGGREPRPDADNSANPQ